MNTEGFEQWFKVNKNFTTPLAEWNKTTTEICRRTAQQNLEMIGENFSRLSNRLKRFSNIKKPEDFFTLQQECLKEDVSSAVDNMQKIIHHSMENMEELTKACGSMQEEAMTKPSERERPERFGK